MELSKEVDEALERLWIMTREESKNPVSRTELNLDERITEALFKQGFITFSKDALQLTEKGNQESALMVRRHRLAERLLVDVLNTEDATLMHDTACKFEHHLGHGLDENICTLLGHPKTCPHGKAIPPGRCCQEKLRQAEKVVSPLSEMVRGRSGVIAYLANPETSELQKLMSMGVIPGTPLKLLQSFPSYLMELGQTQFAVDRKIADAIYVRLTG